MSVRRSREGSTYPDDWQTLANDVKEAAGWCCVRCGAANNRATGNMLTVHHLDLDPANRAWWNLAALCQKCHLTIQSKVVMERVWYLPHSDWFKPYVAGYVAATILGKELDREKATLHADLLIALHQGALTKGECLARLAA